jgi:hypothetical protein
MKKAVVLVCFCMLITGLFSQTTTSTNVKARVNKNMAIEFAAGYSMVLGNYGAFDKNNKKSGYAGNGWLAQFTFDWMGKKNFGLAFQYTFQQNQLQDTARNVIPDGMRFPLGDGAWSNHYLLAGPVFLKSFNKISLDVKLLAGVIFASSSNFNVTEIIDSVNNQNIHGIGTGFAYQFSVGLGYTISDHFTFKFNLGILGGWPGKEKQFDSKLIGYDSYTDPVTGIPYLVPVYSAPVEYSIKKVVTTLNPSLGVIFRF